jgi:hypothetical protein
MIVKGGIMVALFSFQGMIKSEKDEKAIAWK